jgi:DNA-binding response OmpR family regulator
VERVLVVEDDEALGAQILQHLRGAGFEPIWWREGHHVHPDAPPDVALVVLDLMLPRVSGLQVLTELRATSDVPVLVLSARDDTATKVKALQLGADDYLTKPFWPEELVERVRARVRRPVLQRGRTVEVGLLRLDTELRLAWVREQPVELTRVEFEFLLALAKRPGAPVSRQWLVNNVLDPDRDGSERTLDVHASRLRKKVGEGVIETVWGIGYRLAAARP